MDRDQGGGGKRFKGRVAGNPPLFTAALLLKWFLFFTLLLLLHGFQDHFVFNVSGDGFEGVAAVVWMCVDLVEH